jgi:antitoxin component HigA of HigAB toxin-antitoxin module
MASFWFSPKLPLSDLNGRVIPHPTQTTLRAPHSHSNTFMEVRGKKAKDLWPLFGSKGITSEVLGGKRAISKAQAKRLAQFFDVSVELFI